MQNIGILFIIISPYLSIIPGLVILHSIKRKGIPVYLNPLNTGLFFLSCLAFISGILNTSVKSTLSPVIILSYLAVAVYLQTLLDDEQKLLVFLRRVWRFTIVTAVLGIIEKIASYSFDLTWIADFYLNKPIEYIYRIYSTFGNPNIAGAWFAAMILIGLYFFESSGYKHKVYYVTNLLILLVALFFSGSRGAILGLEAGFVCYAVFTKNKFTKTALLSSFFVIIVLAILIPEVNHQLNSRTHIWVKSLRLFMESPVLGVGTFGVSETINKLHAHNLWISILTLYGVVGFGVYLWIRYYIYRSLIILHRGKIPVMPLLAALQTFFLVHGTVDFIIMSPQGGILFFASSAIIIGLVRRYQPQPLLNLHAAWLGRIHPPASRKD